jgi:hypothetical protein
MFTKIDRERSEQRGQAQHVEKASARQYTVSCMYGESSSGLNDLPVESW